MIERGVYRRVAALTGFFLFVLSVSANAARGEALEPDKTYVVIAGVLQWKDAGFSSFPAAKRKDQELHDTLGRRGVPAAQRVLLLDQQATAANMTEAVERMIRSAPNGSTFIFYYAGHGVRTHDDYVFASYDIRSRDLDGTGFRLSALTPLLAKFKGTRIILMADCCYSGGLATVAQALKAQGKQAAALTSADATNTSTANWTFTQTVIDALNGRDILDLDGGGTISLGELAQDVRGAMRNRDHQRYGYANFGVPESLEVARTRPAAVKLDPGAGGHHRGSWVRARRGMTNSPALVLGAKDGRLLLSFYDYATETERWADPEDVEKIAFRTYPVGSVIDVTWQGKTYPAKVIKVQDGFHWITYPGYKSTWDEWVTAERIVGLNGPQLNRARVVDSFTFL